ncbi:MAG TPA: hypothetical protein DDX14_07190 [Cyanobacteria bacterium UBA9579]|nr:hypothetical protein [Cyanobacteria bacterium UBA9579]
MIPKIHDSKIKIVHNISKQEFSQYCQCILQHLSTISSIFGKKN